MQRLIEPHLRYNNRIGDPGKIKINVCKAKARSFCGQRGYSLIEVTVVLILVILFTVLSINIGSYMHRLVLRTDIERLYITIKYVQQLAKATHTSQSLILDIHNHEYRHQERIIKLSSSVKFDVLPNVKGPPSDPKELVIKPVSFENNRIRFHPDGTIDAGSIYLVDTTDKQLYAITCGIGGSSYIRIYHYDGTWHLRDLD